MITVEYRCEDGTSLPVHFRDEEEAAAAWQISREHGRDPRTPLGDALERTGVSGSRRAYEEVGMLLPPVFGLIPDAGGFAYYPTAPTSPEQMVTVVEGCSKLIERFGSALGIWHRYCLPRTKRACADIDAAGDDRPLTELVELQCYGWQMTMIPSYVCGNDLDLLARAIRTFFDDEAPLVAHELAQGFANVTLGADQRLWELGRIASADAAVVDALGADDIVSAMTARRAGGGSPAFFAAVDAFLAEFGARAEGWDIACPTWNEQREGFWAQVAHMASEAMPEPAQAVAAAARRRAGIVAKIEARFGDDAAGLARFQRRLARIESYVFVREERAQWQVTVVGSLRHAALRRGRRLAQVGIIDDAEDVLFLTPAEVESPSGDLATAARERRAAHAVRCGLVPPARIGGATSVASLPAPAPLSAASADGGLRGVAASRGVATGPARVILDLDDADRVEPGDVLVCVMTSPPWTAVFGIVAAVVADTGDIGSHAAIAAREYGIPCVLGIDSATRSIPDGTIVTVDGAAGTVTFAG